MIYGIMLDMNNHRSFVDEPLSFEKLRMYKYSSLNGDECLISVDELLFKLFIMSITDEHVLFPMYNTL